MTTDPRRQRPQSGERMSTTEYFQLDNLLPDVKYEYQDGKVRLIAGGSKEHDDIAFNIRVAFKQQLHCGPCSVQGSDMRVQLSEAKAIYVYPDVTISCDVADQRRGSKLLRSPRIVVEVLSPSTEKDDRTSKLKAYQACSTIKEIVLVNQFARYVELYRRPPEEGQTWQHLFYEANEEVELVKVNVRITLCEIYKDINFDEPLLED